MKKAFFLALAALTSTVLAEPAARIDVSKLPTQSKMIDEVVVPVPSEIFAVLDKKRMAQAPGIPTVDEAGLPGFYLASWNGLWAPKGTPKDVIARLNAAVVAALSNPEVRKKFADLGQVIPSPEQLTPAAFGAYHKEELEKWLPIIKAAGIRPQ